ncbi:hypothetical protein GOEFS_022_00610 [Gordonia effusa NBRC 100432]|uniref:UPF0232 protein GOEFS_022_00610 n=1 Tax=Gordonia effusa NBRC 100432 TaxID=1077974 RepID=H0QWS9_9ACTN|nr:DUF721 family protein [Gordonia effusa]GAB17280.1 hypothetical protein GOEFS_022_00610 [Gordonia effusa NBRC 100432]
MSDGQDGLSGYELARKALEQARAQGKVVGRGKASPVRRSGGGRTRRRWSGPGPDSRDPQPFGKLTGRLADDRGWQPKIGEGTVFARWREIVGDDIAAHATPSALDGGILQVQAESTAWATQLRYVQAQILAKIAAAVGDGVVTSLRITGPKAPSWRKGERHVSGRGPRDTYG